MARLTPAESIYRMELRFHRMLARMFGEPRDILSYPKSGRTWVMNVFANYAARLANGITEPLPYSNHQKQPCFRPLNRFGISFTHGGPLNEVVTNRRILIPRKKLERRHICLLLRDPRKILRSYYFHIDYRAKLGDDFRAFLDSARGIEPLIHYLNYVVPAIERNPNARIVFYEALHPDNPHSEQAFFDLLHWAFRRLDETAARWAIEACTLDALRRRRGNPRRLREAKRGVDDEELMAASDEIMARMTAGLNPVAADVLSRMPTDEKETFDMGLPLSLP